MKEWKKDEGPRRILNVMGYRESGKGMKKR